MKKKHKGNNQKGITNIGQMACAIKMLLGYYNNINERTKEELMNQYLKKKKIVSKNARSHKKDQVSCKVSKTNYENKINKCSIENGVKVSIPIIIGEKCVDVLLEEKIELDYCAFEIIEVKNNIYLKNTKVIPYNIKNKEVCIKGKIFIEGNLENRIQYSTIEGIDLNSVSGDIKYKSVYIPFECNDFMDFQVPIDINSNNEFINPVMCSIKSARIFGNNIYENQLNTHNFKRFEERILLRLHLVFIQEKNVEIRGSL